MQEDDLVPISALQHLLFCERQCSLIHVERLWAENRLTVEGQHLHRRAHGLNSEWKGDVFVARGLRLRSMSLGVWGQADVVEFTPPPGSERPPTNVLLGGHGLPPGWQVFPIEYKRGRPKENDSDRVQLCAQAICLEEMLGTHVPCGAIFYGQRKRRKEIAFDVGLRETTIQAAGRLIFLIESQLTPTAQREAKCDACSLINLCLPDAAQAQSASQFLATELARHLQAHHPKSDPFSFLGDE